MKQKKECTIVAIKQLPYNPKSKNSEGIGYFEEVFLKTTTKTYQFVCDEFLTFRPLTGKLLTGKPLSMEMSGYKATDVPRTQQ